MPHTFHLYLAWQTTAGIYLILAAAYRILMFIKAGILPLIETTNPLIFPLYIEVGGAVASWLVSLTPDRVVQVRALAGNIVLCYWARHLTLTVPLPTQVYKWVPANLMLGVTLRWTSIPFRGE